MRKAYLFTVLFITIAVAGLLGLTGCSQSKGYADGTYFAQEKSFNPETGWKSMVTLVVKDGKIVSADWTGANIIAGPDKKTASKTGKYPMVEFGGAQSDWHTQAEIAEAHLLKTQDPADIEYSDDKGHTDALTGVSVHVNDFFTLAAEALEAGPMEPGTFKDGVFHAEEADFNAKTGWKETADFTVVNGYVVAASWSGVHKDGGKDKKTKSIDNEYGMVAYGNAQSPWYVQAVGTEGYFIANQGKAPAYSDNEGHTDAISGVSISVMPLFKLGEQALVKR